MLLLVGYKWTLGFEGEGIFLQFKSKTIIEGTSTMYVYLTKRVITIKIDTVF